MRIKLPLGRSLFFLCALLFAQVALLPLRLALDWLQLDERGFAAREASGSVWFGSVSEAQVGSVALGDLQARLRTLPLLAGRARIDMRRLDEGDPFRGAATISRHSFGVDDLTARLDLGSAFAPLPLASLDTSDVSARFTDGSCSRAEGMVKASIAGNIAGISLPDGLSGAARCDDGALLLPLVSQSGMEALNLRIRANGRFRVELAVRASDDATRQRLAASGFQISGAGYAMTAGGVL